LGILENQDPKYFSKFFSKNRFGSINTEKNCFGEQFFWEKNVAKIGKTTTPMLEN
jgi:hypothetical protein